MSRARLNHQISHHTQLRHNRREQFQQYFMDNMVIGKTIDVRALAKKTRLAESTTLAYLAELRIKGFAEHHFYRPGVYGFQLYMAVWSRIK